MLVLLAGGGGGLEQFSVSPRPLGLGLKLKGLGLRVWGQGLTTAVRPSIEVRKQFPSGGGFLSRPGGISEACED